MSGDSSGSTAISFSATFLGEAKAVIDVAGLDTKTCGWAITFSVMEDMLLTSLVVIVSAGAFAGLVMGSTAVFFSATLLAGVIPSIKDAKGAGLGTRLTCGWAIILLGMEEILLITFVALERVVFGVDIDCLLLIKTSLFVPSLEGI